LITTTTYKEFEWNLADAGNGESGVGLTNRFIERIGALKNVKSVCDLGCGNGYLAGRLAELGYKVTGVDASESGIAIAQANFLQSTFVHATIDSSLRDRTGLELFD
jgi:2-polyprenyl-6-hydroxyphenyl methylase/3-demethylubiquinone-9 3-methyltransferase